MIKRFGQYLKDNNIQISDMSHIKVSYIENYIKTRLNQGISQRTLQVELAMKSKRTWRKAEDVIPLTEPCKIYPALSEIAANLLSKAPEKEIGAGIIPRHYTNNSTHPIIEKWSKSLSCSTQVKNAIAQAMKGNK